MNIVICENNCVAMTELKRMSEEKSKKLGSCVFTYTTGEALLQSGIKYDLAFLDIELGEGMSGLEVAKKLQLQNKDIMIVFVSGYTKYIPTAFHLHSFQFLLKPIDERIFYAEFDWCVEQYQREHSKFIINQNGEKIELEMSDIAFIESDKRKLLIHDRRGKKYEMYGKIGEQEAELRVFHFTRIHKSYLVNCKYIKQMKEEEIVLYYGLEGDGLRLPLSRRCRDKATNQYHAYLLSRK